MLDELVRELVGRGRRLTSYPARINLPSGGTKLSSPGLLLQCDNLTHGWKTGNSIVLSILCLPDGEQSDKRTSGTPETLAVNAIDPVAKAERGRPDGAIITDRVSTIST